MINLSRKNNINLRNDPKIYIPYRTLEYWNFKNKNDRNSFNKFW